VAFLIAFNQNDALLGRNGLLPVDLHLKQMRSRLRNDMWAQLNAAPTLLWFVDEGHIDVSEGTHLDRCITDMHEINGIHWSHCIVCRICNRLFKCSLYGNIMDHLSVDC
jgi:hypothetical protein